VHKFLPPKVKKLSKKGHKFVTFFYESKLTNIITGSIILNMSNNSYIFSWDMYGIESIIPIKEYEFWDQEHLIHLLGGGETKRNPLNSIIQSLILRAQFNPQRYYEIYAVSCDESCTPKFWKEQWENFPQETANIIRERGHKLYSSRIEKDKIKIT